MSRKKTTRAHSSLGHLEDAVFYALEKHFPASEIELYKQWHAGASMTTIAKAFNLKRREVEQVIKQIEDRIDSCLSWYRVEALMNLEPKRSRNRQTMESSEIDEALIRIAALRVDRIAENEAYRRTIIRHEKRNEEFTGVQIDSSQYIEIVTETRTPLDDLGLSCRAYNAVSELRARFVEDVCSLKREQLLLLRNCGPSTVSEIEKALSTRGLALCPDDAGKAQPD